MIEEERKKVNKRIRALLDEHEPALTVRELSFLNDLLDWASPTMRQLQWLSGIEQKYSDISDVG